MSDTDITRGYHRGDPQSTAAHAATAESREEGCKRTAAFIEAQERGATADEVEVKLRMPRQTASARCSDCLWKEYTAFLVRDVHRHLGLFLDIEEYRMPISSHRKRKRQVHIGWQRVRASCSSSDFAILVAAVTKHGKRRAAKEPIDHMTDALWVVYNDLHACGRNGTTADAAQHRLRLDQGNCSNRYKDMRAANIGVLVRFLHKHNEFMDVRSTRQTRLNGAAAVVVSFRTVLDEIDLDKIRTMFTEEELGLIVRLLFS